MTTNAGSTKQILAQSLLCQTTTCLMRPATTFFVSQMKKTCPKQPLQNVTQQKIEKQTRQQCINNKHLSEYIYSIAAL